MFRYGIKVLEVKHGYKSYLAIKNLGKLGINDVKDGVTKGDILGIWEFGERDLNKLKLWQAKMQTEMRSLTDAGVTYTNYVYHDELGWQPIAQLDSLLQKDVQTLQFVIERDQQAFAALKRYQHNDNPTQALDELISLMPDETRAVLYDAGPSPSFNTRLHRMLPMLDNAETRMLAYELDSHVRRQSVNLGTNFFSTPTPNPAPAPQSTPIVPPIAPPLEAEYQIVEETALHTPPPHEPPPLPTVETPPLSLNTPDANITLSEVDTVSTQPHDLNSKVTMESLLNTPTDTKPQTVTRTTKLAMQEETPNLSAIPWWLLGVIALLLLLVAWLG
ncbi:hypothetical protein [Thiofilum flexile]|uniref:hypothetical protein n=1 Tax=Thiofilum flexile TaxID=125627 RepID=UPI0013A565EB|nr:hypothetical protein [Thiofilum flexile]